ncbi:MAG: hypothetical protein AUJ72_00065 [Candidatus Omnitrophica bacterium CG1_02_46_14]|nr:MAG: hypothetical protein AUJ72_00065 [Candidatus Omnitrophica bacterium CG1_02_46_14]
MNLNIFKNSSWPKRENTFVISGIAIVFLLAAFVIYPSIRDIRSVRREIVSAKAQLLEKQSAKHELKDILASYEKNQAKLELFDKAVMNKNRELEFITSLENIAVRHGLEQKINVENYRDLPEDDLAEMSVQLLLRGAFKDELSYLQDLEKLPAYINISQINITAGSSEPGGEIASMLISADTFWQQ